jgi:transposase
MAQDYDRYPSDLTEEEWEWMKSMIPGPARLGRPARYDKREILNAIFYLVRSGCGWRMMPVDLPPWRICYYYFARWQKEGVWERLHTALRELVRVKSGKKKPQLRRLSTRRALRLLATPDCVALMLARRLWDESGMWSWIPSA